MEFAIPNPIFLFVEFTILKPNIDTFRTSSLPNIWILRDYVLSILIVPWSVKWQQLLNSSFWHILLLKESIDKRDIRWELVLIDYVFEYEIFYVFFAIVLFNREGWKLLDVKGSVFFPIEYDSSYFNLLHYLLISAFIYAFNVLIRFYIILSIFFSSIDWFFVIYIPRIPNMFYTFSILD